MRIDRPIFAVLFGGLLIISLSGKTTAGPAPCVAPCAAIAAEPVLSGGDWFIFALTNVGDSALVTGSELLGIGHADGIVIESAVPGVTFEHLTITTTYPFNLTIEPAVGSDWTATPTSNGIELDNTGREYAIGAENNSTNGAPAYYGLAFKFDATNSSGVDTSQFAGSMFTFTAVPEPGMLILGSLLTCGGLFVRSCLRKK